MMLTNYTPSIYGISNSISDLEIKDSNFSLYAHKCDNFYLIAKESDDKVVLTNSTLNGSISSESTFFGID